jgi:Do/DeqQ family serine protease
VLTNHHVIDGADDILLVLADGRRINARVRGTDPESDLAVLKADASDLPAITFGDLARVHVGDAVLAIGNNFGFGNTVTSGIVSALGRSQLGGNLFADFIQTDAAINPGNSGGALVDAAGRLIGINSTIYSRSGGSQGIGFAIPANMVRVVVASAKGGGSAVKRPWLGAKLQAVTPDIADSMGLKRPAGALIASVVAGGPAAQGGLKAGDVIVSVDGQAVDDPNAFDYRFATKPLGGSAKLGALRAGRDLAATVALQTAPETPRDEITIRSRSPFSGAKVANLSPALADELQLQNVDDGVVILDVDNGSYASNLGFQRGDVIADVNGERIAKTRDLERLTKTPSGSWRIGIIRHGQKISAVFNG